MSTHLRLYELVEGEGGEPSRLEASADRMAGPACPSAELPPLALEGFRAYLSAVRPNLAQHYLVVPVVPWDGEERRAIGRGLRAIACRP